VSSSEPLFNCVSVALALRYCTCLNCVVVDFCAPAVLSEAIILQSRHSLAKQPSLNKKNLNRIYEFQEDKTGYHSFQASRQV
jgi:hypothetical protein